MPYEAPQNVPFDQPTHFRLLSLLLAQVYVKGSLDAPQTFLVDIGTGYFVEKNAEDADNYYKRKEVSHEFY